MEKEGVQRQVGREREIMGWGGGGEWEGVETTREGWVE